MNTRLQVEHPITEWVTGIDLVRWQIRIAAGQRLSLNQDEIRWTGSGIECRVYAEDPDNGFFPSPGTIAQYVEPSGPGVRVDSGVYAGWTVPIEYDPLLAKLSVWAESRSAAIERMRRAISEYCVLGITTNLRLFERLFADSDFRSGNLHTAFLDLFMKRPRTGTPDRESEVAALLAAAYADSRSQPSPQRADHPPGLWRVSGRRELLR
jgi:acetyl-CoA carboxylase biotin carboxylase subunit